MTRKPKKRTSGPTQPEEERERKQRKVRLSDDELADVDAMASLWALTRSAAIAKMAHDARERARRGEGK